MGDVLKSTLTNADDAETLAHDALTSIDARANEIKKNMKSARKLQDNHEEMKVGFYPASILCKRLIILKTDQKNIKGIKYGERFEVYRIQNRQLKIDSYFLFIFVSLAATC